MLIRTGQYLGQCLGQYRGQHRGLYRGRYRGAHGWGLLELLLVLVTIAVLVSLAYPTYLVHLHAARRADARAALAHLMQAQERWRATRPRYAEDFSTAAGLGLSVSALSWQSPDGYYQLRLTDARHDRYTVHLEAVGAQARDRDCRHLRVEVSRDRMQRHSGPDTQVANPPDTNRRCWGLP